MARQASKQENCMRQSSSQAVSRRRWMAARSNEHKLCLKISQRLRSVPCPSVIRLIVILLLHSPHFPAQELKILASMSHRALRKLREEQLATAADAPSESEEEDDSSSDGGGGGGGVGFAGLMDSDSESESESESESDAEEEDEGEQAPDADTKEPDLKDEEDDGKDDGEEEEEDLDAILSEFQSTSVSAGNTPAGLANASNANTAANATAALLTNLDSRDLDLERSMGSLLGGGGGMGNLGLNNAAAADDDNAPQLNRMHPAMRGRNQRGMRTHVMGGRSSAPTGGRKFVFGKPGETWGRPPSYIGGGLGMDVKGAEELGRSQGLPWPYSILDDESECGTTTNGPNPYRSARWHSFTRSDSYAAQSAEYEHVAASGDVNALALFVADNPYHAEASLQLCSVLFHTNNRESAMDLLKRVLWIYECAAPASFMPGGGRLQKQESNANNNNSHSSPILMDQSREENDGFFSALFRLMRTSCMVGCVATSLAVGRYILSLDPLRDPIGLLLTLDYFALNTVKEENTRFLVDLVESGTVKLFHKEGNKTYCGELTDLPNMAFSYALALFRLKDLDETGNEDEDDVPSFSDRADEALREALRKFPPVLELLLDKNEVNTTGRSFQMDWPSILPHFRSMTEAASSAKPSASEASDADSLQHRAMATGAGAHVIKIFIQRSHKLWSGENVLRWLYDACAAVMEGPKGEGDGNRISQVPASFHPALIRYMRVDPADYEDAFTTLPADANPLDPALVAPALALDPNRRRLGRRMPRGGAMGGGDFEDLQQQLLQMAGVAGGADGMVMIDPDLPLAEVFWRSLMPWARVEGVPEGPPPPNPPNA